MFLKGGEEILCKGCEWEPGTSTAGSRMDAPCVIQQGCGRTHTDRCLPWPGTSQGPALEPSSRLCNCRNLKQYIFASHLVHSPGSCLAKCWGMRSKQGLFLHRSVKCLTPALRNLSHTTAQKDHTGFPATRILLSHEVLKASDLVGAISPSYSPA